MTGRTAIGILISAAILFAGVSAMAQKEAGGEPQLKRQVYIYDDAGRRDPFISLIRPPEEKIKTGIPWLDFDITQMRVVAIVWDRAERYALFGLPDGKYYTIKEGMKIGIHNGDVVEILRDAVLIREMKPDFKGRLMPVDTYLRLRKEEGR